MAPFVVRHQHEAERFPAQDPYLGAMLLNYLSRPNVRHQVTLRARAIDLAGRTQPEQPEWNRLGYGANAIREVPVRIR